MSKQQIISKMNTGGMFYRVGIFPSTTWPGGMTVAVEMRIGSEKYSVVDSKIFPHGVHDSSVHNKCRQWGIKQMAERAMRNAGVVV